MIKTPVRALQTLAGANLGGRTHPRPDQGPCKEKDKTYLKAPAKIKIRFIKRPCKEKDKTYLKAPAKRKIRHI